MLSEGYYHLKPSAFDSSRTSKFHFGSPAVPPEISRFGHGKRFAPVTINRPQNGPAHREYAQKWPTSALTPLLQTSCHIWSLAERVGAHCGWASTSPNLGFQTNRFARHSCQMATDNKMKSLVELGHLLWTGLVSALQFSVQICDLTYSTLKVVTQFYGIEWCTLQNDTIFIRCCI